MASDNGSLATAEPACGSCRGHRRNLAAFWLLGLCNNFSYVIMLSAAYDILGSTDSNNSTSHNCSSSSSSASGQLSPLICNPIGTGAILLADILPTLVVKVTAPFYMYKISYNLRAIIVIVFAACSFLLVALAPSDTVWLSITGVACASFSSGLGEITFLSLTSRFHVNTVSSWSSGTGGAGLFGALSYSGLTQLMSPRTTVLVMLVVPVVEAASYFVLLERPSEIRSWRVRQSHKTGIGGEQRAPLLSSADEGDAVAPQNNAHDYSFKEKLLLMKPLLRYMIPLMFVYVFEYFINQALFELVYFNNACRWLSVKAQYRWYQTIYQLGVFVSRSTVNVFHVKRTWILPILQFANMMVLLMHIYHHYIPNIWIVFVIILWEGLLGGTGYVNTFYIISKQVPPEHKEYSLGVASMSDSFGILTAALSAIPAHNAICSVGLVTL